MSKFREILKKMTVGELDIIKEISDRVASEYKNLEIDDYREIEMDIITVHSGVIKLDLKKLLNFSDIKFAHDIAGIIRHLDRDKIALKHGFLPYCKL